MSIFAKTATPLLALSAVLVLSMPATATEYVTLKSGTGTIGQPDPIVRYLGAGACCVEFPTFTAAHFAAAAAGPPATIIGQAHPAWTPVLNCGGPTEPNGEAPGTSPNGAPEQWIGVAPGGTPETALYAVTFNVETACISSARLSICWLVDDLLGSPNNPAGLYLNGVPVPAVAGGNYATSTGVGSLSVGPLLTPGLNTLYLYNPDLGAAVSGVNFNIQMIIEECELPVEPGTWSDIKSRF